MMLSFLFVLANVFIVSVWSEQRVFDLGVAKEPENVKVPVLLGVMSRCPDALLCESVFDQVLKRVGDKTNVTLSFVGTLNSSEPIYGVSCMHGPQECAGNVVELCAMKYLDQQAWWNYVHCLNFNGKEKIGSPEQTLSCAKTAQFDWEGSGVGKCAGLDGKGTGEEGIELLKASVKATQELGIKYSCTVLINGELACIHDEEWKQCKDGHTVADFVRQINAAYDELNSKD